MIITEDNVPFHPDLKCLCAEGRIIQDGIVRYLPGVHDCDYIRERNQAIEAAERKVRAEARKSHAA